MELMYGTPTVVEFYELPVNNLCLAASKLVSSICLLPLLLLLMLLLLLLLLLIFVLFLLLLLFSLLLFSNVLYFLSDHMHDWLATLKSNPHLYVCIKFQSSHIS